MKIKFTRSYKKLDKNNKAVTVFVYSVSGSEEMKESFKVAMGDFYREDESGNPLWFSTRCVGNSGSLMITSNGKVVADMSQFDQAASLAAQYGGNLGEELAKIAVGNLMGYTPIATAPASVAKSVASEKETETES